MTIPATPSLWRDHTLPFVLLVTLLGVGTLISDLLLHHLDLVQNEAWKFMEVSLRFL